MRKFKLISINDLNIYGKRRKYWSYYVPINWHRCINNMCKIHSRHLYLNMICYMDL